MIDGLVSGRIYGKPEERVGRNDSRYVATKVIVRTEDQRVTAHVIAFDPDARRALLALDDGDAVSVAGSLSPKLYEDKNGAMKPALDVIAHAVLSAYHVQDKRRLVRGEDLDDPSDE